MSMEKANKVVTQLADTFKAGDVAGGKSILSELKILMLDFPIGIEISSTQLSIAISALEMGVLFSVVDQDLDAFARSLSQLKPYYQLSAEAATTRKDNSKKNKKCHILGLNLMYLLVENNLSEFHAELELLDSEEACTRYVSFPINLERQLTVGSYDEVLKAGAHVPDPSYSFFMENLLQTVRDSIADCLEVSYKTMTMMDAVGIMKFDSREELVGYMAEYRDDWIVEGDGLCFQPPEGGSKASDIPSMKLIAQSLGYATELERIV